VGTVHIEGDDAIDAPPSTGCFCLSRHRQQ
jgi:hypothetical protein